jgi:hypothetical protein
VGRREWNQVRKAFHRDAVPVMDMRGDGFGKRTDLRGHLKAVGRVST